MSDLEEKLLQIRGYSFQIWRYDVGHSTLTLRATHSDKKHHNVEIEFIAVQYVQFPIGWHGDFYLASDTELLEIVAKTGMPDLDKRLPLEEIRKHFHLYKADSPQGTIYILGDLVKIESDVEPIYD